MTNKSNNNKSDNNKKRKTNTSKTSSKDNTKTKKYQTKDFKIDNTKIKDKIPKKKQKKSSNLWIIWLSFCTFILVLCFFKLGLLATIFTAIIVILMTGIVYLIGNAKTKSKKRKIINALLIIFLILFIIGLIAFGAFLVYITVNAPKFDPNQLNTKELSILYDKDGNEYAKLGSEKREKVNYDELPQVLVDAIIATEDSRFFTHNGLDAPRFIKATAGQLLGKSGAGGASTLSMQVVKNSFTDAKADSGIKGIIRKFTDIYLAIFKLEKNYTKEEIIEFYVNNHNLGGVIYGVEEASQAYFKKSVSELNLSEAAIIAGMFKAPNYYKPTTNPENATKRRNTVLYLMRRHGYITKEQEEAAKKISVESLTGDATGGINASQNEYQGYIDTVVEELMDKYEIDPYKTSVQVYTNLDRQRQLAVNDVMDGKTYTWKDDQVQAGVSVLDSATGKVLAIGAGRNRKIGDYNYATQGTRQPGSTAKPLFDYGPGIEYNDWSTYTLFADEPYSYSNGRSISNWDNSHMGTMTLRRALALSRNIPALKAFQQVENKKIIEFVQNLGITPEVENGKIHEAHSIGAFTGTNPLQMSAAYAAFSNGGYYNEPYTVEKIVLRQTGETIKHKENKKKVMSDATAYMISSVLQDVNLTGGSIPNVAAKTGTTNFDETTIKNHGLPLDAIRDSWVVGFSTKTVIGMWYGYNKITDSTHCLRNIPASAAKDRLFKALAAGAFEANKEEFKMPDSVVKLPVISGSNPAKIAPSGYTGEVVYELFKKGHEPDNSANAENEEKLAKPGNLKATYANGKVTITWSATPGSNNDSYGELGYNVYLGDTLLGFTTSTSYTYNTQSSGNLTFKVIATYKSYSGLASDAATTSVKIEEKPTTNTISYKIEYYCGDTLISGATKNQTSTATTINASQIPDINPKTYDPQSICSGSRDSSKISATFNLTNNSVIKIYYLEDTTPTPNPTPDPTTP